ncbi:MAG TPA: cyclic nucleotide-binding domain-containing protein [Anaeromyxobacteraceae bacterium]|nr:cyclic nucleotide-binding domain-containing protein [Anaeromyxobacteraceae bacterium]
MAEGKPSVDKLAALRRSPLFDQLSPAELEVLAELSRPRRFARGQVIVEEGELGDSLYVLVAGEVEVLRRDGSEDKTLARLEPPEFFGEMALIDREQRSATVRAVSDVAALQLTAQNFTAFRKQSRDGFTFVVINIARALSSRLRETNARLAARL